MSESQVVKKTPFVTYTVIGLCVLIYIWEMLDLHGVEDGAADRHFKRAVSEPFGRSLPPHWCTALPRISITSCSI